MAQTGYTPISIYYSATTTNVPTAGNLVAGELAINTADGKLFYKDSSGVVQTIAQKGGNGVTSFSGGTTGLTPNTATTGAVTLAGTLAVANGGTGATTSTGSGSVVLATSPTVTNPALAGATSGSVTLAVPAVAGSNTATLPAATGTVMVSGNMPAFSAYPNANQSFTQNTYTKVLFQTESFDTNNNFASSTFTPTVAGYYQVNAKVDVSASATVTRASISIYKNGVNFAYLQDFPTNVYGMSGSCLIYCNGSTDYLEVYVLVTGTTPTLTGNSLSTWFNGCLVRAS